MTFKNKLIASAQFAALNYGTATLATQHHYGINTSKTLVTKASHSNSHFDREEEEIIPMHNQSHFVYGVMNGFIGSCAY